MTRDDILDAAAQIFRKKGYHAASMQDIADVVGLQKASLYHHVSSKQEILLALLDRALALIHERVEEAARRDLSPDAKLREMMRVYLEALVEERDLSSVLLFEHRSLEPRLRARHVPNRDRFEAAWRDVLRQGVRAGVFRCPDPGLTTRALLGVMNATLTWYRPDGPLSAAQIANQYATMFLDGLRASHD